jgi:hypothetical protein
LSKDAFDRRIVSQDLQKGGGVRAVVAVAMLTAMASLAAQSGPDQATKYGAAPGWKVPRTPDGKPDLEGVWGNNSVTPLVRPPQWKGKEFLSDAEVQELKGIVARLASEGGDAIFNDIVQLALNARSSGKFDQTSYDPTTGNYNHFWMSERDWDNRTSQIIDPADGQLPPLTAAARERLARADPAKAVEGSESGPRGPADGPEDRPNSERCITYGVPRIRAGYNSYIQIVQSPHTVAILQEMIHDTRVVREGTNTPLPPNVRQMNGVSRFWWEGDTLVVETTNFLNGFQVNVGGGVVLGSSTPDVKLTERYTRVSPDYINWAITVDDRATWARPWTFMIRLKRTDALLYEYACHEGNTSMTAMLAGARAEEAAGTAAKTSSVR